MTLPDVTVDESGFSANPGQEATWRSFWSGCSPESEIRMWDFYGGRPWVLKHVSRHGKVLDAGCGLGRYVFLLTALGVCIDGLDTSRESIEAAAAWGREHGFDATFREGDVLHLPYESDSLSGYVSLGVIEHFEDGPHRALAEAYRVLRPGGVAVISTPAVSISQRYMRARIQTRRLARRVLSRPEPARVFFQYWYSVGQLKRFAAEAGFKAALAGNCDLKYAAWEMLGSRPDQNPHNWAFRLADALETTAIARLGAQSFVILLKQAETMHCFLCGERRVELPWAASTYLPVCAKCDELPTARYYRKCTAPQFHAKWEYFPSVVHPGPATGACHFCGKPWHDDEIFNRHGFSVPICRECMAVCEISIVASNEFLQPRWSARGIG